MDKETRPEARQAEKPAAKSFVKPAIAVSAFTVGLIYVLFCFDSLMHVGGVLMNAFSSLIAGLFIAYIGFQNVDIIQPNQYTLTQFVDIHGAINGEGGIATALPALLALLGFLIIGILAKKQVKGAVMIGILSTTVLYYLISGTVPSFDMGQIGQSFKDFASIGIVGVFQGESWAHAFSPQFVGGVFSAIMYIITFCLVDMFDTIGTLYGTASQARFVR